MSGSIELEFKPEKNIPCFLIDAPILLPVIILSYLCANTLKFLPPMMTQLMTAVMIVGLVLWFIRFLKYSRNCDETEVRVFPDRIEAEVGMKNPTLTMIEFTNLKSVKQTQTFGQKIFNSYSITFVYKSDFDEKKDLVYSIRDFKNPKPICESIKRVVEHAGLINKMAKD